MDNRALQQFLIDLNKAGYAGGEEKKWVKELDGSTTIPFAKGEFRSNDNFFGGEPYGGRVIVFHKDKPVWIMVYYGWIETGTETDPVYAVLRNALMNMPEDAPFRGPKEFKQGEFVYTNTWEGNVERYSGQEQIKKGEAIVYKAHYRGGLVDKRSGV